MRIKKELKNWVFIYLTFSTKVKEIIHKKKFSILWRHGRTENHLVFELNVNCKTVSLWMPQIIINIVRKCRYWSFIKVDIAARKSFHSPFYFTFGVNIKALKIIMKAQDFEKFELFSKLLAQNRKALEQNPFSFVYGSWWKQVVGVLKVVMENYFLECCVVGGGNET